MLSLVRVTLALSLAVLSANAENLLVTVGAGNSLAFSPSNITAAAGDVINFQFQSKNHSVTQSSFASPCTPLANGVDSGFQAVPVNATAFPQFSIVLKNASRPLFFFSAQDAAASECNKGMVFSLNADADSANSFDAFQKAAEALATSTSASTGKAASPSSASSSASTGSTAATTFLVDIGAGGSLKFNPPNITAKAGDVVQFLFESKNHSITQSSFASPCTPLAGGIDSGFQPVSETDTEVPAFSFTLSNANKPLFFFSKQTAVVNECQQGMVFSVNADPNSAESFAAFQAAAMASSGSSASAGSANSASPSASGLTAAPAASSTAAAVPGLVSVGVGEGGSLTFSPSNVIAKAGDTVQFQFLSKNHSVTQSSFASPCTPLVGGIDSGFQPVLETANQVPAFSFTVNDASKPLFFFSKQTAAVNECQKGMVFSLNADANSNESFEAFQRREGGCILVILGSWGFRHT
ncbi:hypothetical protein R3P38DRAFT_950002 [Favolaschia claudopus]|uniref:Uncharacterized protein n=1 Tax=Favolaschia claudopus TaxID=2862362 RepID=A0AAW0BNH0_9AGAR